MTLNGGRQVTATARLRSRSDRGRANFCPVTALIGLAASRHAISSNGRTAFTRGHAASIANRAG